MLIRRKDIIRQVQAAVMEAAVAEAEVTDSRSVKGSDNSRKSRLKEKYLNSLL